MNDDTQRDPDRLKTRPQVERFKELARMIGEDQSEETFDRALRRVASAPPAPKPKANDKGKPKRRRP